MLTPTHLLILLIVALLVLGPKRLPDAGRALGQGLKEFRSSISGDRGDDNEPVSVTQTASVANSTEPTDSQP